MSIDFDVIVLDTGALTDLFRSSGLNGLHALVKSGKQIVIPDLVLNEIDDDWFGKPSIENFISSNSSVIKIDINLDASDYASYSPEPNNVAKHKGDIGIIKLINEAEASEGIPADPNNATVFDDFANKKFAILSNDNYLMTYPGADGVGRSNFTSYASVTGFLFDEFEKGNLTVDEYRTIMYGTDGVSGLAKNGGPGGVTENLLSEKNLNKGYAIPEGGLVGAPEAIEGAPLNLRGNIIPKHILDETEDVFNARVSGTSNPVDPKKLGLIAASAHLLDKVGVAGDVVETAFVTVQVIEKLEEGDAVGAGELAVTFASSVAGGTAGGVLASMTAAGLIGVYAPELTSTVVGTTLIVIAGIGGAILGDTAGEAFGAAIYDAALDRLGPDFDGKISPEIIADIYTDAAEEAGVADQLPKNPALIGVPQCFVAGTPILLANGQSKPIETVKVGDWIMAFDESEDEGRGDLRPRLVTRTFTNQADEVYQLESGLTVTPGHHFLTVGGRFYPIETILSRGLPIIGSDGRIRAESAKRISASEWIDCKHAENLPFSPRLEREHDCVGTISTRIPTYNFEVSGLHTYVAGGVRVHNKSVTTEVPADASQIDIISYDGDTPIAIAYRDPDGALIIRENTLTGPGGSTDFSTKEVIFSFEDGDPFVGEGAVSIMYDANDNPLSGEYHEGFVVQVDTDQDGLADGYQALPGDGEKIGKGLGSVFGGFVAGLVDDDPLVRIAGSSLGATIGANLGESVSTFLALNGQDDLSVRRFDDVLDGESVFTWSLQDAFGDFAAELPYNFASTSLTTVSTLLVAELADDLGIEGAAGDLFNIFAAEGTEYVLSQGIQYLFGDVIVDTAIANAIDDVGINFNPGSILANFALGELVGDDFIGVDSIGEGVFASIGSVLASNYAASPIVDAVGKVVIEEGVISTVAGNIATQVNGALLKTIGLTIPGLGPLVSAGFALLGQKVGAEVFEFFDDITNGTLSDIFAAWVGNSPYYYTQTAYNRDTRTIEVVGTVGDNETGDIKQVVDDMTTAYLGVVNDIVASINGVVDGDALIASKKFGYHHGLNDYGHDDFKAYYGPNEPDYIHGQDLLSMIRTTAVTDLLKIEIQGGDLVALAAFDAWRATVDPGNIDGSELESITEYLSIAVDYREYQESTQEINYLIADAPDSAFTLGWVSSFLAIEEYSLNSDYIYTGADEDEQILAAGGSDTISGAGGADLIKTYSGNDTLDGGSGADELHAGAGDDTVTGGSGDDVIIGGSGDDILAGGSGSDIYWYAPGGDADVITEYVWGGYDDTLKLVDISSADVVFVRDATSPDDVIIRFNNSGRDQITLVGQASGLFAGVEWLEFSDQTLTGANAFEQSILSGSDGSDLISGGAFNETIYGGLGDDTLEGLDGDDIYVWALGHGSDDILELADGGVDTIDLGDLDPSELVFSLDGDDLVIEASPTGETLRVVGQFSRFGGVVENIMLGASTTPTTYTALDLRGLVGLSQTDMSSEPYQTAAASDAYTFAAGDGNVEISDLVNNINDRLALTGLTPENVRIYRTPEQPLDVQIEIIRTGETLRIVNQIADSFTGIEFVDFADGTIWTEADLEAAAILSDEASNDILDATVAVDTGESFVYIRGETLKGGAGDDAISGGGGDDTYLWSVGDGNDTITEGVSGGADTLKLIGLNQADVSFEKSATAPLDLLIRVLRTNEVVKIEDQFDGQSLGWNTGVETIEFDDGFVNTADLRDVISTQGNSTSETLLGTSTLGDIGNDIIHGAQGDDVLEGGAGDDAYIFREGDGYDTLVEELAGGADRIVFKDIESDAVTVNRLTPDGLDVEIRVAGADDTVLIKDQLDGWDFGVEQIEFADGVIWDEAELEARAVYKGGDAGETVLGTSGNDTVQGGLGDDVLQAGSGSDAYLFGRGGGIDTIIDGLSTNDVDTLMLQNIDPSEIVLTRISSDLRIDIIGTNDSVLISDQFSGQNLGWNYGVERIVFAGGIVWDKAYILTVADLKGGATDNTIVGTDGDDLIVGGGGDDILEGGEGSDRYEYQSGDGSDILRDVDATSDDIDILAFMGPTTEADITFEDRRGDLVLQFADGQEITVEGQFKQNGSGIERIEFADGTDLNLSELTSHWSDVLYGDGVIIGGDLDNTIVGTDLVEQIIGGAGGDTISGLNGDDLVTGGLGNDILSGDEGSDTYTYSAGDGDDIISDLDDDGAIDSDVVEISGFSLSGATFAASNDDLIVTLLDGSVLTVLDQFAGSGFGVEVFKFDNAEQINRTELQLQLFPSAPGLEVTHEGTSGADALSGTSGDDVFDGGLGDDTINSGSGGDIFIYSSGDGSDSINDSGPTSDVDRLVLTDLNAADIELRRSGDHLFVQDVTTGHEVEFRNHFFWNNTYRLDEIEFADGTIWGLADIESNAWIRGTDGNDSLHINAGDQTFFGGLGDDTTRSNTGSDTYIYRSGDGSDTVYDDGSDNSSTDVLQLIDLNPSDIEVRRSGSHMYLKDLTTGVESEILYQLHSSSTNYGMEEIQFADGTVWSRADIEANAWIRGTDGNDSLYYTTGDQTFFGGLGDDLTRSSVGSDTYIYRSGDGSDTVYDDGSDNSSTDVLQLVDLNPSDIEVRRSGSHMYLKDLTTGVESEILYQFHSTSTNYGMEEIQFADGTVWSRADIESNAWIRGTDGNDSLHLNAGDQTFFGGLGDDLTRSSVGSDTYIYRSGDGSDTVYDDGSDNSSTDVLQLVDLNPSDIEVRRSGSHMYLKDLTTGVESEILYQFHSTSTNYGMEEIQFADGTVWDRTAILNATNLAPIVFDLDGDGQVILTQSVAFDYNSDGDIELGSWMDAGDAVLALDRNGDDRITHGGEISFVDDLPGAMTDLEGLAAFDSNGDGVLSASDTSYGDFVLWTDKNGDAVSQLDELQGLESAGVSSLELSRTDDRSIDDSGNIIFGFATAIVGGADVAAGDVSFSFDTEASFDFDGIDDGPIATHSMEIQRIDFGGNENVVSDALGMTGSSFDSDFDFEAIFDPIPVEKEIYEGYLL